MGREEVAFVVSAVPTFWDKELHTKGSTPNQKLELDLDRKYPFYLREHKLGIAFWAISPLYKFAFAKFKQFRCRESHLETRSTDPEGETDIMKITRSMLLISPDCYSAWNERFVFLDPSDVFFITYGTIRES